jgi:hypothetical protein
MSRTEANRDDFSALPHMEIKRLTRQVVATEPDKALVHFAKGLDFFNRRQCE